jgi:dihydroorotase
LAVYDLVIKNGRVIDPAQNIDDKLDVAINGDKVAALARDIAPSEAGQVVDASDHLVTPGLIDLHTHVFDGIMKIAVAPDTASPDTFSPPPGPGFSATFICALSASCPSRS